MFLPDTHGAPSGRHDPKWLRLPPPHSGAPPLARVGRHGGRGLRGDGGWAAPTARAAAAGEHRRLLYVAMTRAAQRLIVAGYEGAQGAAGRLLGAI